MDLRTFFTVFASVFVAEGDDGVVGFAVVLMAVGGFYGAGLLEKKFAAAGE